jgi:hypothetical protein
MAISLSCHISTASEEGLLKYLDVVKDPGNRGTVAELRKCGLLKFGGLSASQEMYIWNSPFFRVARLPVLLCGYGASQSDIII